MKVENQVCTVEQAKKLIELGLFAPSAFVYFKTGIHSGLAPGNIYLRYIQIATGTAYDAENVNITPAYTAAELAEMLPDYINKSGYGNLEISKCKTDHISMKPLGKTWWNVCYWDWENKYTKNGDIYLQQRSNHLHQFETLAQTLAAMLIYLLENNLITVEEINNSTVTH